MQTWQQDKTSGDWTHKYHKMALWLITLFLYWTFLYLLPLIGIFFHYLFVLTYFDSLQWHKPTGTQIVCAKMTSLNAIFCRGNKLSSRSLARFCCRKHKKFTAQASCSWKILSSTCRQVYGTMYNSSKLCMHLLCSAFMLRNLQWTLEPTIWLLRGLWRVISEQKYPGDWLQEKKFLQGNTWQKNSNTENKNLS